MHLQRREAIWEQELYNTFEYKEQRSFFHIFEADVSNIFPFHILKFIYFLFCQSCMAGLNFSNDNEARHFADTVIGKLQNRVARLQG